MIDRVLVVRSFEKLSLEVVASAGDELLFELLLAELESGR